MDCWCVLHRKGCFVGQEYSCFLLARDGTFWLFFPLCILSFSHVVFEYMCSCALPYFLRQDTVYCDPQAAGGKRSCVHCCFFFFRFSPKVLPSFYYISGHPWIWIFLQEKNLTLLNKKRCIIYFFSLIVFVSFSIRIKWSVRGFSLVLPLLPWLQAEDLLWEIMFKAICWKIVGHGTWWQKTMLISMEMLSSVVLGYATKKEVLMQMKFILRFTMGWVRHFSPDILP